MRPESPPIIPDLLPDPFGERSERLAHKDFQVLGARVRFSSNSRQLLRLAEVAYGRLPRHQLAEVMPDLNISLQLTASDPPGRASRPPQLAMMGGAGLLGCAAATSNCVFVSPQTRAALVVVSPQMLRFPYNVRYEMIEFAVFVLAARVQTLVPLHAACVGKDGRGLLLMGSSGAGKSTTALHWLLQRLEFLAEDSVFVDPRTLLATGVSNFLHVRGDSLHWLRHSREAAAIRRSPVIQRRSAVRKYELDLRRGRYSLAAAPLQIVGTVFLSAQSAGAGPLLRPLRRAELFAKLATAQAYAAGLPEWPAFRRSLAPVAAYELRRGSDPSAAVEVLQTLLVQ